MQTITQKIPRMVLQSRRTAILISGIFGFCTAYAILVRLYSDELGSVFEWVLSLSLLTIGFAAFFFLVFPYAIEKSAYLPATVKLWGGLLAVTSAALFCLNLGLVYFVSLAFAGYLLISFTLPALQAVFNEGRLPTLLFGWAASVLIAFFALGFLKNFYPAFTQFLILSLILTVFLIVLSERLLGALLRSPRSNTMERFVSIAVLMLGFFLIILTVRTLTRYPDYFSSGFFLPEPSLIPVFFGTAVLSLGVAASLLRILDGQGWWAESVLRLKDNLPGLVLALTVSCAAFLLGSTLVSDDIAFLDMFFQTDSPWWVNFLTADADRLLVMRAVHPFVLLILRPPVWLLSLLLNGDRFYAAILLNALGSGVCVFLVWWFFKKRTGNAAYSLLIAALLGFSNAHLVMGSLLESYIFSAIALITFFLLLSAGETRFTRLVPAGLITFGITITNFIQTCIGLFLMRKNLFLLIRYVLIVLALAVPLAFAQDVLFPTSDPFYIPSMFEKESFNVKEYNDEEPDFARRLLISRANVTFRNIILFSVVAPRPLILYEAVNCSPLCFRMINRFRGEYEFASYIGLGSLLARTWFLGLLAAAGIFAWRLLRSYNQAALQAVLFLNLVFNFALHLKYGDDPLIYTPNWTYALVFFFGISFEPLAHRTWWQILLLAFAASLVVNNLGLFNTLLENLQPFFP
jgi:hypothetical protein